MGSGTRTADTVDCSCDMLNLNASLRARAWRVNRLNLLPLLTDFSSSAAPDVESGQVRA